MSHGELLMVSCVFALRPDFLSRARGAAQPVYCEGNEVWAEYLVPTADGWVVAQSCLLP